MGPCCGSCVIGCRTAPVGITSTWELWEPSKVAAHPFLSPYAAAGVRQHPPLPRGRPCASKNDQQLPPATAPPQPEGLRLQSSHCQRRVPLWGLPPAPLPPAPPGPAQPLLTNPLGFGQAFHQSPHEHRPVAVAAGRQHIWCMDEWEKINNKSTLRPWVGEDFANLDLCKTGCSLYAPVARCWRGWNKAEVLSGGCRLLPLWLCVPSALAGQGAWHGGAGLVGRELGNDVWVALRVWLRKWMRNSLSSPCSKSPGPNPGAACRVGWWRNTTGPGDMAPLSALGQGTGNQWLFPQS